MVTKIYTSKEFIKKAYEAYNQRSCYVTGCFGAPLNYPEALDRWIAEWNNNKKHEAVIRDKAAKAAADGVPIYGWDCINYIKGLLYGWDNEPDKEYGGAVFLSNGVPDLTVYDFFNQCCTEQSTDFSTLVPGEMLYYNNGSHCGIYVGDGYALEATGKWDREIAKSAVINLLVKYPELAGADKQRSWQAHGKITFIDYTEEKMDNIIICPCCGAQLNAQLTLSPYEDLLDVYTVQNGDSPWSIAVKYYNDGTLYYKIMDYNGLKRNAYIYTGQQLKIPRL